MKKRLLLSVILLLAGCATPPPQVFTLQADSPFAFNGRVAFKQGDKRESAGVRWEHQATKDEILLLAPLGQTVARIHRDDLEVLLEASGKRYLAHDMESLMQQVLGWQLPLSGLRYWVIGLPDPGSESSVERAPNGQIRVLRQQGWEIRYTSYAAETPDALPLRLSLQHDGIGVQLLIDGWELQ